MNCRSDRGPVHRATIPGRHVPPRLDRYRARCEIALAAVGGRLKLAQQPRGNLEPSGHGNGAADAPRGAEPLQVPAGPPQHALHADVHHTDDCLEVLSEAELEYADEQLIGCEGEAVFTLRT